MRFIHIIAFFALFITLPLMSQNTDASLPYAEIPEYPIEYTDANVAARMIDGLGFRFYWASEDLRDEDLNYRPTDESRSTSETIDHVLGLSHVILNASLKRANGSRDERELTFEEKRKQILFNLKKASDILKSTNDLEQHTIIFQRNGNTSEFPFWNNINGPIADAIWHAGQMVMLRRMSGNPINPKVNVFLGKLND
ncbi:MAG: hypothetical protein ACWA5P_00100 [bacterium]